MTAASTAGNGGYELAQFQYGTSSSWEYCCSSVQIYTSVPAITTTLALGSVSSLSGGYACQTLAQITAGNTASNTPVLSTNSSTSLKIGLGVGNPSGSIVRRSTLAFRDTPTASEAAGTNREGWLSNPILAVCIKPELPDEPVKARVELDACFELPELVAGKGLRPELAENQVVAELATHQDEVGQPGSLEATHSLH